MMRTLVFSAMPESAGPQSHIASGPWCFAGREGLFPGWDEPGGEPSRYFPLPPDPYADADAMALVARQANEEALRLSRIFCERLFPGRDFSERFIQMALAPFFLLVTHMLAERQKRVLDLVELYGNETLRVVLLPEGLPFSFADSVGFMLHGVQDVNFNYYVFSRIVEAVAPPCWKLEYGGQAKLHRAQAQATQKPAARFRAFLSRALRALPFPRCKGFSPWQLLALSLAVLANKRQKPDATLDFSLYCESGFTWRFPAEKLIDACIPLALSKAKPNKAEGGTSRLGPLRGMSPSYSQDDAYRLRLALLREKGCRLFSVQHGANYGNLKSIGGLPFEYCQHAFFTWGWKEHEGCPANAIPLPHPALVRIADRHREENNSLILVGSEMSTFSYRLKSRTQAGAMTAYRRGKVAYLSILKERFARTGMEAELLYRPYFKVASGLEDADYVLARLPGMGICTGDLITRILSCRLLVLDHYGTTLHMALAANVPCLMFWKATDWSMDAVSEKSLELFRRAGLLHERPEDAAEQTLVVWEDVQAWWRGNAVQKARQHWLDCYANIRDTTGRPLSQARLTRIWAAALRYC